MVIGYQNGLTLFVILRKDGCRYIRDRNFWIPVLDLRQGEALGNDRQHRDTCNILP
jgi:hypothetical protein